MPPVIAKTMHLLASSPLVFDKTIHPHLNVSLLPKIPPILAKMMLPKMPPILAKTIHLQPQVHIDFKDNDGH
eukprot:4998722-Ditylum_brightwellii.AAC.1